MIGLNAVDFDGLKRGFGVTEKSRRGHEVGMVEIGGNLAAHPSQLHLHEDRAVVGGGGGGKGGKGKEGEEEERERRNGRGGRRGGKGKGEEEMRERVRIR